jgi:hypothetical protein
LLQRIIREKARITKRDLNAEIDEIIAEGDVSSNLAADLDMIRTIGNFVAHPIKSTDSGQVVPVEPGEAEALLDVLEPLFDHYFVRPAKRAAMQERVNQKLADAGKQPLKGTSVTTTAEEAASSDDGGGASASVTPERPGSPPVLSAAKRVGLRWLEPERVPVSERRSG